MRSQRANRSAVSPSSLPFLSKPFRPIVGSVNDTLAGAALRPPNRGRGPATLVFPPGGCRTLPTIISRVPKSISMGYELGIRCGHNSMVRCEGSDELRCLAKAEASQVERRGLPPTSGLRAHCAAVQNYGTELFTPRSNKRQGITSGGASGGSVPNRTAFLTAEVAKVLPAAMPADAPTLRTLALVWLRYFP